MELKTFYKNVSGQDAADGSTDIGHFNILKVEDFIIDGHRKEASYSRRNFFKVSLVTGKSTIHYADRSFDAEGSILVFTNPMVPYHWEIISPEQSGFICIFTESFFSRFGNIKEYPVFQSANNAVLPVAGETAEKFKNLFIKMVAELEGGYAYKYDLLRNLLMECIHEAQKLQPATGAPTHGSNAAERIAGLFGELLERQFPIEMSNQVMGLKAPSEFALHLNIHVNHLNKALKEITRKTTSQCISERVFQEAKVLLKNTNWTVAEIARGLGFEEPNHFSGFFKNHAKISPMKFRSEN